MSKVVHLSDEAHAKAKVFCKSQNTRMSDWVAALIHDAIDGTLQASRAVHPVSVVIAPVAMPQTQTQPQTDAHTNSVEQILPTEAAVKPSGRQLKTLIELPPAEEPDEVPRYSKPPFWA